MKRILYVATSLSHKRAFEPFVERAGLDQMIAGPAPKINEGIVPEDYSDFKIKKIKYFNNNKELQAIVDKFKPDVFVQASLPCAQGIRLPSGCKKVYVSHGLVGNHVKGMIKKAGFNTSVWKGCDLYCGAWDSVFTEWIQHTAKVGKDKILLNALPQLDILYDGNYYNSYRKRVLDKTKNPNPSKVILFVGFCCKTRPDFVLHNEDYFKTVLGLDQVAAKNNWLIMVKPRHTFGDMIKFLKSQKWGSKYVKPYRNAQESKHLHFITTSGHIYRYFFADAIVVNGCSTIEVEACAANKPLVVVRTHSSLSRDYDPYMTVSELAANVVDQDGYLWHNIDGAINDNWINRQKALIQKMGITFDGQHHKRIQERILKL